MKADQFENILDEQIQLVRDVLVNKAAEYANEDRLSNFRIAAKIQNCSVSKAIAGMMVKHTVSIYDMVESDMMFPMETWDEKITDHINYLILLRAAQTEKE